MKKVSGYISVRALGIYKYEFFVEDNATEEEIKEKVEEHEKLSHSYIVEEGYEKVIETSYKKNY